MKTRILLTSTAILMALAGLALSFMPQEILQAIGSTQSPLIAALLQVAGAVYLGFGLTNWMSRGVIMGGIYARPLAIGNFLHFGAGALALLKQWRNVGDLGTVFFPVTGIYCLFAIWFGLVVFTHPLKGTEPGG